MMPGKRTTAVVLIAITTVFLYWWFCLPARLFDSPYSTIVKSRDGELIGARIAADMQWRFPPTDSVPHKFERCLLTYEDRDFYTHNGISWRALLRALRANLTEGRVVSGASTLTMQVMRMAGNHPERSYVQKLTEMMGATRAEWRYDKSEILNLYASHAPFGGNVVGLDAAAWRYYRKPAYTLTWAEAAALAVLPNAPGLIYPGRNPDALRRKRDRLLLALRKTGDIDAHTLALSVLEPLPGTPFRLPETAYHLSEALRSGQTVATTLDANLQTRVLAAVGARSKRLAANHVNNAAAIVVDNRSGDVLAYVGNTSMTGLDDGTANDMIVVPRSSGSILKPFLFEAMLKRGMITPRTLVPDIPTQYSDFVPKNFDYGYSGAVPAEEALARSLNIPAVRMLKDYGVPSFHKTLSNNGFTTIKRPPEHYGLSLVLGGAEVTLWDLAEAYRRLALTAVPGLSEACPEHIGVKALVQRPPPIDKEDIRNPGVAWSTLEAMAMVTRPDELAGWQAYGGAKKIAWKTGTSTGFRDAWAVGVSPGYTVGIWVGNADGAGRPGLTGLNAAAPLLFDIFELLPGSGWFAPPKDFLEEIDMCSQSGMRASLHCDDVRKVKVPRPCTKTVACSYCRSIHLDSSGGLRVDSRCYPPHEMKVDNRFVLPTLQAWYYRRSHPGYRSLPDWMPGCGPLDARSKNIHMIYPANLSRITVPRELNGIREKVVLKAAHNDPNAVVFWHIDDKYLGTTSNGVHHKSAELTLGRHTVTLIDERGARYSQTLWVDSAQP